MRLSQEKFTGNKKKIIGQEVYFEVSEEMAGRSYGTVWLGNSADGENLTAWSLKTGNSVLRESVRKQVDRLQSQVGEDGEESEVGFQFDALLTY